MKNKKWMSVLFASSCLLTACQSAQKPSESSASESTSTTAAATSENKTASVSQATNATPDFELMGIDGKTYKLSDLKGKKVYVKFWASWCSICLAGLKEVDQLAQDSQDDFVVLSVVAPGVNNEKTEADFEKWFNTLEYKQLPVLKDVGGNTLKAYGVRGYPTSAFIDSQGNLVKVLPGHVPADMIKSEMATIQ